MDWESARKPKEGNIAVDMPESVLEPVEAAKDSISLIGVTVGKSASTHSPSTPLSDCSEEK